MDVVWVRCVKRRERQWGIGPAVFAVSASLGVISAAKGKSRPVMTATGEVGTPQLERAGIFDSGGSKDLGDLHQSRL